MNSTCCFVRRLHFPFLGLLMTLSIAPLHAQDWKQDDFRWMHGANYVASYAATDVEMWLHYDHTVIDREFGFAEKMGLNCVRVDRMMHLWRVPETAEKIWNESPSRTRRFLQGFCDGLNDYRKDHADECKTALEADPVQVWSIVPYGQSRRPESRHYSDQARLFSEGRMRPAWHAWSQLRDHVQSVNIVEYSPKSP